MLMGNRRFIQILLAAFLLMGLASCSDRMPIPRKVMQKIYYDMMLADSYVEVLPEARTASDSIAVYPPLIEKYGYSVDDFLASQAILLKDPEKMSRIFEANAKRYHDSADVLLLRIHERDSLADIQFQIEEAERVALDEFLDSISFAKLLDTLQLTFTGDSLIVDTLFTVIDSSRLSRKSSSKDGDSAGDAFEDTEETAQEVEMEFKEMEEPSNSSKGAVKEKKPSRKFRLFGKKKSNLSDDRLKEIEEKFK